ncbi:hypothetical protein PHMEG_00010383 [Phytophthora megakarya]|uniref:Uncharacterized protein n=1 Tax=Phytophthora megakarya TaxID=4795 RepID=A0A225WFK5_9STRA|nr:hypothetical protein PHMEG_00010383 [Phytophthora megakarya]
MRGLCCCLVTGALESKFVTWVTITDQPTSLASVNKHAVASSSVNVRLTAVASISFTWS